MVRLQRQPLTECCSNHHKIPIPQGPSTSAISSIEQIHAGADINSILAMHHPQQFAHGLWTETKLDVDKIRDEAISSSTWLEPWCRHGIRCRLLVAKTSSSRPSFWVSPYPWLSLPPPRPCAKHTDLGRGDTSQIATLSWFG